MRRVALWGGKLLLAAALLALIADAVKIHSLLDLLRSAQPLLLLAALLLLPLNIWLQLRKWRLLVHSRFPGTPATDLRASLLLGFTFGVVTPARLGEFGGRVAGFRGAGMQRADLFALAGLTAIDKFATMLVTVLVGLPGLLLFAASHPFMDAWLLPTALGAGGLLAAVGIFLILRPSRPSTATATVRSMQAPAIAAHAAGRVSGRISAMIRARLSELRDTLRGIDRRRRIGLMVYSGLFYLTFLLPFFLLLSAFGPVQPLSAIAGIVTIMFVKTVIPPVTLGELGIREGASVLVLGHAGILPAAAFNASLLLFVVNLLLPALAGLALLLFLRKRTDDVQGGLAASARSTHARGGV